MPEEEPGRGAVPSSRWPRRPDLRTLLSALSVLPTVGAMAVLVSGDPGMVWVVVVSTLVTVAVSGSPEDDREDERRRLVPELTDEEVAVVRAHLSRGELPEQSHLRSAAVRYGAVWSEQVRRRTRRLGPVLAGWLVVVALADLVLVSLWPDSASVRHPAAVVAAAGSLLVGGSAWGLAHRRDRVLTHLLGD